MKKITTFFIILFFIIQFGFGQNTITDISNYQAIYNLSFQKDSTDINSKQNEKMILLIGNDYSFFESLPNMYNDSIKSVIEKNNSDYSIAVSQTMKLAKKARFRFKILKNATETWVFDSYFSNKFVYEDTDKINWRITNKRAVISGYKCILALTSFGGRKYRAWFTPEIPISTGPYKFKGLPGLIVKIEDDRKQYVFQLESFQKKKKKFIFNKKAGSRVTKKQFFDAYNSFKKSFIAQLSQRGISFDNGTSRQLQKHVQKSRNNEIEIKY